MDLGIGGKTALVLASSKGLGRGAAMRLAEEGCRVAICARHADEVRGVAEDLAGRTGSMVCGYAADVSTVEGVEELHARVTSAFGPPDILVTNAGGPPPGTALDLTPDNCRRALEANCLGAIRACELALPHMRGASWGRIIMITSMTVKEPGPELALSNLARTALTAYMKTLARQVAAEGITVNAVLPGGHDTDRARQLAAAAAARRGVPVEQVLQDAAGNIPAGQLGDAGDFGGVVAFLASQSARFITGANIPVDGGASRGLL